ncbi:MAG: hypothetical protein O2971_06305 [Proteobacteria bacterium]|nr:hypothetical protein [Pseudomonadota bacterium]
MKLVDRTDMESSQSTTEQVVLPLVVAVTGHRDLVPAEIPQIRARVASLLQELKELYPDNRLTVMSPLAEGADMLVAEVALELCVELIVPLPKPRNEYIDDFRSESAKDQFEFLCSQANQVFELACSIPPVPEGFEENNWKGSYPYAHLGTFLCAHCHILLAIWDGKDSNKLGGTAQVVKFHHDDVMLGLTPKTAASQQMLVDDESDLVFHIPCSRNRVKYEENSIANVEDSCWFTKDEESPRSKELPAQHKLIFQRSTEFSADAIKFATKIEAGKWSLLDESKAAELPEFLADIDRLYCVADWLAIHYQKKTLRTLLVTHVMAFLMGLMFILYSDLGSVQLLLFAFLGFFAIAAATQYFAKHGAWQRKYLDYRTLAEGLRVQFYWAAAGVTNASKWKFAHDNYLQSQNPEFGWIRNVMRVAGILADAKPNSDTNGVKFTLEEWVGGPDSGQLGYFKSKAYERIQRQKFTENLGKLSLVVSVTAVFVFLIVGSNMTDLAEAIVTVIMGSFLLLYGVREGYAYATATKELVKQYEFMLRIFDNAHRRLSEAQNLGEKRQILAALGQSALDEHSDWILMHRERSLDESEIWRMGS